MGVNPTLVIGLGGTGREVLLRIRRRFFEEGYRAQPWISYLWVDTEASLPDSIYSSSLPFDYVGRRTKFNRTTEVCDIGVDYKRAQEIARTGNQWKNLWEWCEPDVLDVIMKDDKALSHGAKQQPPLGRLALFINADRLQKSLNASLNELNTKRLDANFEKAFEEDQLAKSDKKDLQPSKSYNIMVVGSLAGGTGAGCCIDVAAMLRPRVDAAGSSLPHEMFVSVEWLGMSSIAGYFILPMAFLRDTRMKGAGFDEKQVMANGYAMLQEIEMASLNRSKNKQFLTGREKAGMVHATWLYRDHPQDAPWVEAPIYQSTCLFDGYGDSNNAVTTLNDNFELAANLLHTELSPLGSSSDVAAARNNQKANGSVHYETVPRDARPEESKWTDLYSLRFSAAGMARITYEAPRLRQMAVYTMAEKALSRWLGETLAIQPGELSKEEEQKLRAEGERLRSSTEERLKQELLRQGTGGGTAWLEVWKSQRPYQALIELSALIMPKNVRNFRLKQSFERLDREQPQWDAKALSQQLYQEYVDDKVGGKKRLDGVLRALVHAAPLTDLKHDLAAEKVYAQQGGVSSVELAVGTATKPGMIFQMLNSYVNKRESELNDLRERCETLKREAEKATADADNSLADYEKVQNDIFILPGVRKDRMQATQKVVDQAKLALRGWAERQADLTLKTAVARAWRDFLGRRELKEFLDDWRKRLEQTRRYLIDLLEHPKNDANKGEPCGLRLILKDLRELKSDSLTKHRGEKIQENPAQLDAEIRAVYDHEGGSFDSDICKIQDEILKTWGELLQAPLKLPQPPSFTHVVDLANHKGVFESLDLSLPVRLQLDEQIDRMVEIARATTKASRILWDKRADQIDPADLQWLKDQSQVRLELERDGVNPRRCFDTGQHTTANLDNPTEHRLLLGPNDMRQRLEEKDNFNFVALGTALEVKTMRFEFDIPLPTIRALHLASKYYADKEPRELHFSYPKSGYLPVHALPEKDADEYRERTIQAILAVLLGQFRPIGRDGPAVDEEKIPYFEFLMDPASGPQPCDERIKSISDLVRYLGQPRNSGFYKDVTARNKEILNDLGPHALVGLQLILEYNLRFIAPLAYLLCTKEFLDKLKLANPNFEQEVHPYGPQQLIIEGICRQVNKAMSDRFQDWNGAPAKLYPRPSRYVTNCRELLSHWLHHFSAYVPSDLRQPESQPLLCLLTEIEKEREVSQVDDLLLRKPPEPGDEDTRQMFLRLALKAPWLLYSNKKGLETLRKHWSLTREGSSMQPPGEGDTKPRDIPNGWQGSVYYNENAVKAARFYRVLFKSEEMISDRNIWAEYEKERQDLAKQEMRVTPIPLGPARAEGSVLRGVAQAGAAANPLDQASDPFSGLYTNAQVALKLVLGGDGYTGELTLKGQVFPIKASIQGGVFQGQFFKGVTAFPFQAKFVGDTLEFRSGQSVQLLTQAVPRAAEVNPLEQL